MSPFGSKASGARRERMQASARFSDGAFHNTAKVGPGLKKGQALSTMSEFLLGGQRRMPLGPLPSVSPLETWLKPPDTGSRATWLGHSTVLLELDGVRLLTDPVWGERASPMSFAGPRRFQPVPVPVSGLPPLDAVLISHDHYDHLDYPTLLELAKLQVPFYVPLGVGAHLEAWGVQPCAHHRARLVGDGEAPRGRGEPSPPPRRSTSRAAGWGGATARSGRSFAVASERHSFFFSGDTGLTDEYDEIRRRLGPFELVMLEVGAFHPAWGDIHLGPEGALKALELLGGGTFLPVHWGTFNLAIHAWDQPAEMLIDRAPKQGANLLMPMLGAPVEPGKGAQLSPWWRSTAALEQKGAPRPREEDEAEAAPLGEPID